MLYVYVPGAYVKLQAFNVFGNGATGAVDGGTESRETGFVGGAFTGAGDTTGGVDAHAIRMKAMPVLPMTLPSSIFGP